MTTTLILVAIAAVLGLGMSGGKNGDVKPVTGGGAGGGGGGGTGKPGGGGGGLPGKPGTKPDPKPTPKPKPTTKPTTKPTAIYWGTKREVPSWFEDNSLWVSPDCETVMEGRLFEAYSTGAVLRADGTIGQGKTVSSIPEPTLVDTLAAAPDNGVYGFAAYLIEHEGFTDPEEIALRVLIEANALCADIPPEQWPQGLEDWFFSLVERIEPWVADETGQQWGGFDG
jgi:hypothetical protein